MSAGLIVVPLWSLILGVAWYFNLRSPLQQARIKEWKAETAALTR